MQQLIKVTNAWNGQTIYVNTAKIIFLAEVLNAARHNWAHHPLAVIHYGPGEDENIMTAESLDKLLDRFPPV